ncbi:MAG: hypothetical protein QXU32_09605 [Nitrososphaerales archaeon]
MPPDRKKTSVMSFRLDDDIVDALRQQAEEEEISLNVLANHIFRRYVEWERDAQKAGFIPVTKELLMAIINEIDDKKIEELVRNVSRYVVKEQILYMESKYNLDSFLKWLDIRNKISGFAQKHVINGREHEFIIQHDMNLKWSLYLKTLFEVILGDVYRKKVEFEITPATVIFKLER